MTTPADIPASAISSTSLRDVTARVAAGDAAQEVLRQRPDGVVLRITVPEWGGHTMVAKLWKKPGWRGTVRHWTRSGPAFREWSSLNRLHGCGVAVPKPLAICCLRQSVRGYTEAIYMEDLGKTIMATDHVKSLLARQESRSLEQIEEDLIGLTASILRAGIVDTDHGLVNTVVLASNRPVRLDFEIARSVVYPHMFKRSCGLMIGRLVGTYAFAVQPDIPRATRFAERVAARIRLSSLILHYARRHVNWMMATQRDQCGIDMRVDLSW